MRASAKKIVFYSICAARARGRCEHISACVINSAKRRHNGRSVKLNIVHGLLISSLPLSTSLSPLIHFFTARWAFFAFCCSPLSLSSLPLFLARSHASSHYKSSMGLSLAFVRSYVRLSVGGVLSRIGPFCGLRARSCASPSAGIYVSRFLLCTRARQLDESCRRAALQCYICSKAEQSRERSSELRQVCPIGKRDSSFHRSSFLSRSRSALPFSSRPPVFSLFRCIYTMWLLREHESLSPTFISLVSHC